jgi:hypothetical protein
MLSLRRWRPGHLLASWAAYWTGLAAVTLGPLAMRAYRVTRLPDNKHGTISASFNDGLLEFTVAQPGATTFVSSMPFSEAVMWVVVPPLALWLLWLVVRSRGGEPHSPTGAPGEPDQLSPGAPPASEWHARRAEPARVERDRQG